MKNSRFILRLGFFLAFLFFFTQCEDQFMKDITAMQGPGSGGGNGGGSGGGGIPSESVGSNLSFPVIWAEGVEKALRTPPAGTVNGIKLTGGWWYVWGPEPVDPQSVIYSCNPLVAGSICYGDATDVYAAYLQKDANNYWEAYNAPPLNNEKVNIDFIDWGDNLESIDWGTVSKVRTEVVLYEALPTPQLEYAMRHVYGWGTDEMHGLQTEFQGRLPVLGSGTQATVYSPHARFTIQKLTSPTATNLTWDADAKAWTGDVNAPIFNKAVWEAGDGPGYYNAEVNIKGKIIYGYTWDVKKLNEGAGTYRLTFSFDNDVSGSTLNTFITDDTQILVPIEEEIVIAAEEDGGGGTAYRDPNNNLTYIDIKITAGQSGGGSGKKPIK